MNIDTVKSLCELIINKNQSGTLTPARFNTACESVNWDWFNTCYGQPALSKDGKQINDLFWQSTEKVTNNLRPFLKKVVLQIDATGKAIKPTDYVQTSSCRYWYGERQVEVDFVNDGDLGEFVGGELLAPTKKYPIHVVYDDRIQFYPKDLSRVEFTYLRKPETPVWGYATSQSGRPVYDPTTSVDFEFPEENLGEIVSRLVKLWGVNIREKDIVGYAQSQINSGS